MDLKLPKPAFASCDETSLKLRWDGIDVSALTSMALQYKEVHETWEEAKDISISNDSSHGTKLNEADVVDLKPGTPYFVRLVATSKDGQSVVGPETVFDTKPIDCTPKKKSCIIS